MIRHYRKADRVGGSLGRTAAVIVDASAARYQQRVPNSQRGYLEASIMKPTSICGDCANRVGNNSD